MAKIQEETYKVFILNLVKYITKETFNKLKYFLDKKIGCATMEKLQDPLDLFKELERRDIVGHENLDKLRDLLVKIQEPNLVSMLDSFAYSCGIYLGMSQPKVIAKPPAQNYLEMDGYSVKIQEGQHYGIEENGEFVELPSGSNYSLCIGNANTSRCRLDIKLDGHVVIPEIIVYPKEVAIFEGPSQATGLFTFFALDHAPPGSGINKWKNENGLVEAKFTPEKADMLIRACYVEAGYHRSIPLTCSYEATDVSLYRMIEQWLDGETGFTVYGQGFSKPISKSNNTKLVNYGTLIIIRI